jgi:O-methyltransferase
VTNRSTPPTQTSQPETLEERYLDLVKRSLTRLMFENEAYDEIATDIPGWKGPPVRLLRALLAKKKIELVRRVDPERRYVGDDWPTYGETMIGMARLNNLQECVESVLRDHVPGDLIETGIWRGGAGILMRAVLAAWDETERSVWLADSFQGVPKPNIELYESDAEMEYLFETPLLTVGIDEVKENFRRYALLDDQVKFLEGWFRDTLPTAPIARLAVLRLDGDLYESTIDALNALYPKLSIGGYAIIDDFHIPACVKATNDYRTINSITEPIRDIDGHGVFWRREHGSPLATTT